MILAHWTYTKEEWKAFARSDKRKRSGLLQLVKFFLPTTIREIPEVRITPEKVFIGKNKRYFRDAMNQLRQINIREEGSINIMEITFESVRNRATEFNEIRIPVPKGKLKEAFEVEEKLNEVRMATQRG